MLKFKLRLELYQQREKLLRRHRCTKCRVGIGFRAVESLNRNEIAACFRLADGCLYGWRGVGDCPNSPTRDVSGFLSLPLIKIN